MKKSARAARLELHDDAVLLLVGGPLALLALPRARVLHQVLAHDDHRALRARLGDVLADELGAVGEHRVLHLGRGVALGARDAELLDLLKLMHAEDTKLVPPMGAGFLPEASRVPGILDREVAFGEPVVVVVSADWLFRK